MSKRNVSINRHSDSNSDDHWLKQFEANLQKGGVQPKSQTSLFDQLNSIINKRQSKYSSVEEAVDDMKERSGLTAYLAKVKKSEESLDNDLTKNAQVEDKNTPTVIVKYPAIFRTLENIIRDSRGNLPVPTIIDRLKSIHRNDLSDSKDWDENKLVYLVSQLNLDAKKNNPNSYDNYHNLGSYDATSNTEIDPSNTDAFYSLNPSKS